MFDRDVHAARPTKDVAEFQAGLADGGVVDDRQEARGIGHQGAIEQRLVVIEEPDQIDVAIDVAGLVPELLQYALELHVLGFDGVGQQPGQLQRFAFGVHKGGRFGELGLQKKLHARLARESV